MLKFNELEVPTCSIDSLDVIKDYISEENYCDEKSINKKKSTLIL
jgi:hypothetical protein